MIYFLLDNYLNNPKILNKKRTERERTEMRLRSLREDHDYTQVNIAKILNCKQNTYQQYESQKRQIPLDALATLAIFYDTSVDYILGLTDEIKHYPRKNLAKKA